MPIPAWRSEIGSPAESLKLAGTAASFATAALLVRSGDHIQRRMLSIAGLRAWAATAGPAVASHVAELIGRVSAPRPPFAGLALHRPRLMGILNVTPDSFSDGGRHLDPARAVARGVAMLEAGADILDIGGESTRPGADPVDPDKELSRVLPVVRELAQRGALVSIDTRHGKVMAGAIDAGARIVNDVSALTFDPDALRLVASRDVSVVLMHMRGEPTTMQKDPHYRYAPVDIFDALAARIEACRAAGMADARLCVDPGIGFGKTIHHNLEILGALSLYHGLGIPLMLGASRKGFIGRLSRGEAPGLRLPGSLAAALLGLDQGVHFLRVHDVAETAQAIAVWRGIRRFVEDDAALA